MGLKWKQRLFAQKSQFLMESGFLMELPEKLLHSSSPACIIIIIIIAIIVIIIIIIIIIIGPACKVGSAQAAFLELGPEH